MNSRHNFALLFLSLVLISGCSHQVIELRDRALAAPIPDNMVPIFLDDFGSRTYHNTFYPARICGGIEKVARVETQISAWNILHILLSFGSYQPRQVKIYCTTAGTGKQFSNALPSLGHGYCAGEAL